MTLNHHLEHIVDSVIKGTAIGQISDLHFRAPDSFRPGELHRNVSTWEHLFADQQTPMQSDILRWIRNKVSIFEFAKPLKGKFHGHDYESELPPSMFLPNNQSCKAFVPFIRQTILARRKTGAVSVAGKVGKVRPPYIVHPLTVEPHKPRLCYDARYVNLWIKDWPFTLDRLINIPR